MSLRVRQNGAVVECESCPFYGCHYRCKHPQPTHTTTQEPPMPTLEHLAQQLAAALANLDDAKKCADALKEQIRQHPTVVAAGPDKFAAGDATLVISPNRRFDQKKALPLIPEDVLPLVTYPETVIDREKLKALLPEVYESAQTESAYRVGLS